jgi:hypothetical protein
VPAPPAPAESRSESAAMRRAADEETNRLFREVRRLLAVKKYEQVIDRLDVHRPAEWAVLDRMGARTLRTLGQAYVGRGDLTAARESAWSNYATYSVSNRCWRKRITPPPCRTFIGVIAV